MVKLESERGNMLSVENAVHPGGFVRAMVIDANRLSVTEAALALGVTRPALSALLNNRADLSADMALRIERVFGIPIERLMRMQSDFDIARARKRQNEIKLAPY